MLKASLRTLQGPPGLESAFEEMDQCMLPLLFCWTQAHDISNANSTRLDQLLHLNRHSHNRGPEVNLVRCSLFKLPFVYVEAQVHGVLGQAAVVAATY